MENDDELFTVNEPHEFSGKFEMLYGQEVYQIIGCCFEVHNALGKGFLENVYKAALVEEFQIQKVPFIKEKKFELMYKGKILPMHYFADFIVFDKIILEIKAQTNLISENQKQLLNYLAASRLKVGLLVNFGEDKLTFKRMIL